MAIRTLVDGEFAERSTVVITTTILDHAGVAIPGVAVGALTGTLYNDGAVGFVNNRDAQSLLNVNGATLNSSGGLTVRLDPDDTIIVNDTRGAEIRVLLLEWTWTAIGVQYVGKAEIAFQIKNLAQVG